MKILLVCMEYGYGIEKFGRSYEYYNFYLSLKSMGHEVEMFDYMQEIRRIGKSEMNQAMVEKTKIMRPDVAVFSLYTDQLDENAVQEVRKYTKTLCFFHDDTWRKRYSQHWAPLFDFFTSADFDGRRKYERMGFRGFIHFPFGVNEKLYKPLPVERKYDVSFVGGWHPIRAWLIKRLRRRGIEVMVAGTGWPNGGVSLDRMVEIFNSSHINLNLSNSTNWDMRYLLSSPRALATHIKTQKNVEQFKARLFEINACKAFQLSYYVDGLERCYRLGEEIGIYISPDDLIEKVEYYLDHPQLREEIADAGYQRTLREHTYSNRFQRVFGEMGLKPYAN